MDNPPLNYFIETKEIRERTETKAVKYMPVFSKKIAPFLSLYLHLFKLYMCGVNTLSAEPNLFPWKIRIHNLKCISVI